MDNIRERFEALAPRDQQTILDKHRYEINFYQGWWQDIYDELILDVNQYGYLVDDSMGRHSIWFSGFCSQGDGACFDGRVWNWTVALAKWPTLLEIRGEANDMSLSWRSKGNYSHSNTLEFTDNLDFSNEFDEETQRVRWLAREQQITDAEAEWFKFIEHTEKHVKELCDALYKKLEEEHDYLTDDEQVLEALISCDMLEDELTEYEDDEDDDEQESAGPIDSCTDRSLAGSLFLWPTGYALEASGGPDDPDPGSGREAHLL